MMKPIGKHLAWAGLLLIFTCAASRAEVAGTVDRTSIALGDTLRFTISATEDGEDISSVDLSPLQRDFEVLQRSTNSSTSIVNGRRSHSRKLIMEITPRREGNLRIPALKVGTKSTTAIAIKVAPQAAVAPGNATVLFEAVVDRDSVYVQGQLLLTLRLQQSVNLDARSISELELDNAFVIPLEQESFQRTIDGRNWLVHEVRYAIFPEQSGTLQIPAQSFSARESQGRRSFTRGGKVVRRQSPPLTIKVLPKPANFSGSTWLPARKLTLEESWSSAPEQLRAGESITRTIRLRGEGLQGAQLPPLIVPAVNGVKFYPDQPSIKDVEIDTGLLGTREDSIAIVPTQAGTLTLPEVRIPWWDIDAGAVRYAVLPAREIQVGATQAAAVDRPTTGQTAQAATVAQAPAAGEHTLLWKLLALVSTMGWIGTAVFMFARQRARPTLTLPAEENVSERKAYKQLLAACASDSAPLARNALLNWVRALAPTSAAVTSLQQASDWFGDDALSREVEQLDRALFSGQAQSWLSGDLVAIVKRLRKEGDAGGSVKPRDLTLYPESV